jgi:hypothetical protein
VQIRLKVGAATELLEVTANAQMLEARSGARSQVVNEKKIIDLPF